MRAVRCIDSKATVVDVPSPPNAEGVRVKVQRHTVSSVLPKGTMKSA